MANLKVESSGGNAYKVYIDQSTNEIVATAYPSGQPNHAQSKSARIKVVGVKDIIMFVPGTTDPLNLTGANHQANKDYWRRIHTEGGDHGGSEAGGQENLWQSVKKLKPQFLDLHIEDEFFSWSGDNNHEARVEGAERLLDLFLRVYKNWQDQEVYLHLIGHSHGGNVINQFTEVIANDSRFPEPWKVKSITYLSTPFFKEQHQLNHSKLHKECKIINVHNEYDITQRFVADFTLKNLESLLANFNSDAFEKAMQRINETNFAAFNHLSELNINNHTEGPFLWSQTAIMLDGVDQLMGVLIDNFESLDDTNVLAWQKRQFITRLTEIKEWAEERGPIFENNSRNRRGGYGRSEFFEDIDLVRILRIANTLFAIGTGVSDSYLLDLLASILCTNSTGIADRIDDTTWTPQEQTGGKYQIEDVLITDKDPYHSRGKKSNYDTFINGIESCVKANKPDVKQELLMRLVSQMLTPEGINGLISTIDLLEWIITGEADTQLKRLKRNLTVYHGIVNRFHADLIAEQDLNDPNLKIKPGSLPYLATTAHSLSHTQLFPKVKEALSASFGSGKNPGYKPNQS
ncbi:hypothetical protein AAG747_25165 [Rapidithrix thailandica]|uniref:Uncharacterized protein n=1 Tax=Rapidithrix thailandica TaxID=413964 RepID=A0AAW9SFF2_9BACT